MIEQFINFLVGRKCLQKNPLFWLKTYIKFYFTFFLGKVSNSFFWIYCFGASLQDYLKYKFKASSWEWLAYVIWCLLIVKKGLLYTTSCRPPIPALLVQQNLFEDANAYHVGVCFLSVYIPSVYVCVLSVSVCFYLRVRECLCVGEPLYILSVFVSVCV